MSCEQEEKKEMSEKESKSEESIPVADSSIRMELDIPGFEYELEENISTSSLEPPVPAGVPRFDEYKHPTAKLFVIAGAVLCNVALFVQAYWNLPRQYTHVLCAVVDFDKCKLTPNDDVAISDVFMFELFLRGSLEFVGPFVVLIVFALYIMTISVAPSFTLIWKNPMPSLSMITAFSCLYYSIIHFLTSVSMLPSLASTSRSSIWIEYLANTGLGLFWMYSMLNIFIFKRLTTFMTIRAREKHRMNQDAMGA